MKKLLPLVFCFLVGPVAAWTLDDVESAPLPQREFFQLIHPETLQLCLQAEASFGLSPDECRSSMNARQSLCAETAGQGEAAMVGSQDVARALELDYQQCVSPGHDCNGFEVRTLDEAMQHCS